MSNCPVCGNASNPGEKFCMKCGYSYPAAQQGMAAPQQGQPRMNQQMAYNQGYGYQNAMAKPPKKKSPVVPIIIAVVALIVVIVGAVVAIKVLLKPGYEKVVKDFAKSIETNDSDLFDSVVNKEFDGMFTSLLSFQDAVGQEFIDTDEDSIFDIMMYEIEEEVGEVESVEYEIKDVDEDADPTDLLDELNMDPDDMRDQLDNIGLIFGDDAKDSTEDFIDSIEAFQEMCKNCDKAYKVDVKMKIKGEDDSSKETITMYVVKYEGDWSFIVDTGLLD